MHATRRGIIFPLTIAASLTIVGTAFAQPAFPMQSPAAGARGAARVWLEGEPSYYRSGEPLNVRYSVPWDAYVAIIHIDSDGLLDFLYPYSPWDDHWVRGGRTHRLTLRGNSAASLVRGGPGIGYLYIIASPEPLDFQDFYGGRNGWGWDYAGRNVYGDPFLAFEQVTRLLLPPWPYARYAYDYHGYYVGGLYRYPAYACGDRYPGWGWGATDAYGPCGRMNVFLRDYPFYYDTRRYQGDRRVYLSRYERYDPRHSYKEDPATVDRRDAIPRAPVPSGVREAPSSAGQGTIQGREPIPARTAPSVGESRGNPATRTPAPETRSPTSGNRALEPADRTSTPAPRETGRPAPTPATRGTTEPSRSSAPTRPADTRSDPAVDRASSGGRPAARPAPQPASRTGTSSSSNSGRSSAQPSARPSAQPASRPEARGAPSGNPAASAPASSARTARPRPGTE